MHMARQSSRKPSGNGAYIPPDLPQEGPALRGKRNIVYVDVDDPSPDRTAPIGVRQMSRAAKNRCASILENEYAARRLSEAAYRIGRSVETALETIRVSSGGQWLDGSRVDAATAHEKAIASAIDKARKALAEMEWVFRCLGEVDSSIVIRVLRNGEGFAEVARTGRHGHGERAAKYVAWRFRDALEYLAQDKQAEGRTRRRERDDYDVMAAKYGL